MSKRGMTPDEPVGTWHPSRTTVAMAPRWMPGSLAEWIGVERSDLEGQADCVERLTRAARMLLDRVDWRHALGTRQHQEYLQAKADIEAAERWGL